MQCHAIQIFNIRFERLGKGLPVSQELLQKEAQGLRYRYGKWESGTGHKIEVQDNVVIISTNKLLVNQQPKFLANVSKEHATIERSVILVQHHVALNPSSTHVLKWEVEIIEDGTSAQQSSSTGNTVRAFACDRGSRPNMFFFEQSKKAVKTCQSSGIKSANGMHDACTGLCPQATLP